MSVAGGIRAGSAFVEIKAHDNEFQAAMGRLQERFANVGNSMRRLGSQLGMFAGVVGAPLVAAVMKARSFDDAMREIQASVSDLSPDQLKTIADESIRLGKAMGAAPSKFANAFLALVKAGMPLEDALKGGAKAAVEFAKVGQLEVAQAAELMTDAMNVFGVSAEQAGHAISSAADASSTDIQGMSMAMAQAGAVAGMASQSIDDTSAALAILAAGMLKGSDAGTSLKTMLLRLMTPSGDAVTAMARLGLNTKSFVDQAGKPLPLPKIIGVLNERLSKLDAVAKRDALGKLFGSDAIRAAQILTTAGTKGFDQMRQQMAATLPLAEKYKVLMGGISGLMDSLEASAEFISIAFSNSLGPAFRIVGNTLVRASAAIGDIIKMVPGLGPALAGVAGLAGVAAAGLFLLAGAAAAVKFVVANLSFLGASKGLQALAPALTTGAPRIVQAMKWVAVAIRWVVTAIGALGGAIASIGAAPLAAIAAAIAVIGGGLWWLSQTPSGNKKTGGKGKPKGAADGKPEAMPRKGLEPGFNADQLQAAMVAPAPGNRAAVQKPFLTPDERSAVTGAEAVALLRQILDVTKSQRPAFT
jgi:TP901 family phage tail tape measure protein